MTRHARGSGGFTLIEVMMALIVFGTGVLALGLCIPAGTRRVTKAGQQTRASELASETAEELLTVPYGNAMLTAGAHNDPENPHGFYHVRWSVEDNAPIPACKRITVLVSRGSTSGPTEARVVIVTPQAGG